MSESNTALFTKEELMSLSDCIYYRLNDLYDDIRGYREDDEEYIDAKSYLEELENLDKRISEMLKSCVKDGETT